MQYAFMVNLSKDENINVFFYIYYSNLIFFTHREARYKHYFEIESRSIGESQIDSSTRPNVVSFSAPGR